jgi:uncharacterized protein (TIGR02271 family)
MAPMTQDVGRWRGTDLVDPNGSKIGRVEDVYLDEETNQPEWLAVATGLFGTKVSFVPITGTEQRNGDLVSRWTKDQVKDAPRADADGHLSQDEEAQLYRHYGVGYSETRSDTGLPAGGIDQSGRMGAEMRDATRDTGRDTSGPSTDSAMTRSEEELRVGTERQEAGRVRLRKWVETEHVAETVPVQREEVRIEREPITDANVAAATSGPDISEEEHEMTVYEERAVVDKETVPKERVRLDKDVVTEQERVGGDVRKERIEVEGTDEVTGRRTDDVDPAERRR